MINCPQKKKKKKKKEEIKTRIRILEGLKKPINWIAPFRKVFLFRKDTKKTKYIMNIIN